MRAILYAITWLFTSRAEWARIRGHVAQRIDPRQFTPQAYLPASHEEWKAYVRAAQL